MRKIAILIGLIYGIVTGISAQDNPITVRPYGYISYEMIYDTYRSLDTRDGELYFFPRKPVFDANGNDINERSKFNMLAVQSRFGFNVTGPDILGAKASGRIEADFFGTQQEYVRLLRLRVAFMSLKWEKTELMMGNNFHPMFSVDNMPGTISFAAAVPFHPLNRSPQVRVTQTILPGISASISLLTHGYHASAGPSDQQRNSGLPDSQLQVRYQNSNLLLGATAGYKYLSPRDVTTGNIATSKNVGSYNLQAFSKVTTTPVTIKMQANYGENMSNFIMIGGYGAKGVNTSESPFDWNSDYDYANLKTLSLWTDIHNNSKVFQWGLFAGYTENLGSDDPFLTIPNSSLHRYTDVHYVLRFSPRFLYYHKNFTMGIEPSWISAAWVNANGFDMYRKPVDVMDPVSNWHIILMARYTF